MRYSPNGQRHIVMERWEPRRLEVADAVTGAVLATFPSGFNPRWLDGSRILAESPDGVERAETAGAFIVLYEPANRGQLDANGHGWWAVSDLSKTTVHVGPVSGSFYEAREPRLSASGDWLATRHPATGELHLRGDDLGPSLGPCEDSRWSSETLVWWLGGRVLGRSTPDAATVELTVPGRACSHACPFWDGSTLWVGLVLDEGELWVAGWADLAARNGLGRRVGVSSGSAFDWDFRSNAPWGLQVVYFDPLGVPVYAVVDTSAPSESMLKTPGPVDPPPPPPPPPPTGETMQLPDPVFDTIAALYDKYSTTEQEGGEQVRRPPAGEANQRALQERVCQTVRARHGAQWGWKRSAGEPSADAIAFRQNPGDAEFFVWDCCRDAGGPERQFSLGRGSEGERVRQTFIEVPAKDWLGDGTGPIDPGPEPPPPTGDLSEVLAYLKRIEARLNGPFQISGRF